MRQNKRQPSINAQASMDQNLEAALKLFPVNSSKNEGDSGIGDTNGTDFGENGIDQFLIEVAANGFLVTTLYEDGSSPRLIFDDFNEVLSHLKLSF